MQRHPGFEFNGTHLAWQGTRKDDVVIILMPLITPCLVIIPYDHSQIHFLILQIVKMCLERRQTSNKGRTTGMFSSKAGKKAR